MQVNSKNIIEFQNVSKSFGAVKAARNLSFSIPQGKIVAIVGENGAGKSTAMNLLFAVIQSDSGVIKVRGREVKYKSPLDAIADGIGMVHQHFMLAGPMTVLDNMIVGAEKSNLGFIHRDQARSELSALIEQYQMPLDLDALVEDLPVGLQQKIEILKTLYRHSEILILDEPTAVLTPHEVTELYKNLNQLKAEGKTILLITHKLKEVMTYSDEVMVFRAGEIVKTVSTQQTTLTELAEAMVGRSLNTQKNVHKEYDSKVILSSSHFQIQIKSHQILGIAGVEGSGQEQVMQEFLRLARLENIPCAYIPSDRHEDAVLLNSAASENYLLGQEKDYEKKFSLIDFKKLDQDLIAKMKEFDIRPVSTELEMKNFSGGNQQKIVVARELNKKPRLLIVAQPTRGVDIGAIEFIHSKLIEARDAGMGILLISSELDELYALSDQLLVMFDSKVNARFNHVDEVQISKDLAQAMGGQSFV